MRLRPRSLRSRLTLVFTLGAAAALGICLVLLFATLQGQLTRALGSDLTGRSDDLAAALRGGEVDVVTRDPLAQLYAADGTVITSSSSLGGRRLLDAGTVRRLRGELLEDRSLPAAGDNRAQEVRVLSRVLEDGRVLSVGVSAEPLHAARRGLLAVLLVAAPFLLGALAAGGWLLLRAALHPVDVLAQEAASIASFQADRRLAAVPGDDEIARLAATLDDMLTRLRLAFERERAFVDDASHELRTPIAVLRGELELALAASGEPAEVARSLRAALAEAERLSRLAEDLLLLARERAGGLVVHREPVDLVDVVAAEAAGLQRVLGVSVLVRGDPVVVRGDAARLRQLVGNLVRNSAEAGSGHVRVTVTADTATAAVEVADDGPGFPAGFERSAFDRFARSDRARGRSGSGAGLGLSIVRAVATAHGGTVVAANGGPLGGAVVAVRLPVG